MKPNPTKGIITLTTLVCIVLLSVTAVHFVTIRETEVEAYYEEEEGENGKKYWETGVDKQLGGFFQSRAYPDPTYINDKFGAAWQHAVSMRPPVGDHPMAPQGRINAGSWTSLNGPAVGRVLSIAIHPTTTTTLFIGTASGGIWKSTNSGTNWSFVSTGCGALGVPTIVFHPTSPNIILAGTGEVYRVDTSNIGFNVWKARGTYGAGIIRSTDGGNTWDTVMIKSMAQLFGVLSIKFDPTNPNNVFAATTHGLFKSTDAGLTWGGSPILDKIYVSDVVIRSTNNQEMMAAVGNLVNTDKGIYRTTDGGTNWTKIVSGAIPTTFSGFSKFAYLSNGTCYISMGRDDANENELFRTLDFGVNWTSLATSHHCQYQFWFANCAAIIPSRPDTLFMGGVNFYRYRVSTAGRTGIGGTMHSDHHDIKFDPSNNNICYVANDGGVFRTANAMSAASPTFTEINNGLNISQFYASFGVSQTNANRYVGGLQDNGVWSYFGGSWAKEFGGDGGPSLVDPNNDANVFASNDARSLSKTTGGVTGAYSNVLGSWAFVGDDRTGFMAPVAIAKTNSNVLYVASDNFHRTANGGTSWTNNNATISANTDWIEAQFKTGIAIAVSPLNENRVFVSLSNMSQRVDNALNVVGQPNLVRSLNGGTTKENIKNSLPNRFVLDIVISPTNDDSIFVTLGGFGGPHIYVTGNAKAVPAANVTWTALNDPLLPDVPFNAICFDPVNRNIIYAGSDVGVYVSPDRGATWYDFNGGIATTDPVMIFDLQTTFDNKIVAATHGRGAWRSDPFDPSTLPVTIKSFTGVHDRGTNKLKWVVEQESNIRHYEVERSTNSGTFVKIGTVNAVNSVNSHTYTFNDPVGTRTSAKYYYRLRAVELDNTFKYSSVVMLQVTGKNGFTVLGNPVTDRINMQFELGEQGPVVISLYDMRGRLVKRTNFAAQAGLNSYSVPDLGRLPKGMYILEALINRQKYTQKILKN